MSRDRGQEAVTKVSVHTKPNDPHGEYYVSSPLTVNSISETVFDPLLANPFVCLFVCLQEALAWSGTCSGFWCLMRVLQSILPLRTKSVGT